MVTASKELMPVKSLTIKGLRGFSKPEKLRLAKPTGKVGSGLTILVGPNSGGKSTIIEAFGAVFSRSTFGFSESKRNQGAGDSISLLLKFTSDETYELRTVSGSSETVSNDKAPPNVCFCLPSRRFFNPYFNTSPTTRDTYMSDQANALQGTRSAPLNRFSARLFKVLQNIDEFNEVLKKVVNPAPKWAIELSDQGSHYVKLNAGGQYHTTDGLGEGIVSLLFIVDALYDSEPGDLIVIDEPELSLHPTFQRRLARLFAEYAKDRQIVYATHSPYFADFIYVVDGATVARVHKCKDRCVVSQISTHTSQLLGKLLGDDHNPHTLGLEAREALFREDGVIVVEGQEDVIYYSKILDQLVGKHRLCCSSAEELKDRFFGWGAGGAGKVDKVCALLRDLGYDRVSVILDGNECHRIPELKSDFRDYHFHAIPADDVRSKPCRPAQGATNGLLDDKNELKPEFLEELAELFKKLPPALI